MPASETTWKVARNGVILGPYSLLQLQRHLASGEIVGTDLAQSGARNEWLPVAELFPLSAMKDGPEPAAVERRRFPDPPDLRWWLALIFGVLTLGAFFVVWDVVEAAWLRRVERSVAPLVLYGLALVLFIANLPSQITSVAHALSDGAPVASSFGWLLGLAAFLLRLFARFMLRSKLLRHFNQTEPLGLKLNWFYTLSFGGLYFQYHFNRLNAIKAGVRG